MLCPKCGYYAETDEPVCPACGEILKHDSGIRTEGAQAIRQGKRAREAAKARPAQRQEFREKQRRRSGASHATVEMPVIHDEREEEAFPVYPVSETALRTAVFRLGWICPIRWERTPKGSPNSLPWMGGISIHSWE